MLSLGSSFFWKICDFLMLHLKRNTVYDVEKFTKARLSINGGNLYYLGKILSGWMIYRIKNDLMQMPFKSADNFAKGVITKSKKIQTFCVILTSLT